MARVYNFSAGPAVLPEEVLREAAQEMLDYKGSGMSVMEMSHRSKTYDTIIKEAEADLRELMNIPDNYKVLFLQGGASLQFAMIPMNLMKNRKAAYIVTGQWAKKAYQEAKIYGEAVEVASSADQTFSYIPDCSDLSIPEDADYVYICENNTIYGTKFKTLHHVLRLLSHPVSVPDPHQGQQGASRQHELQHHRGCPVFRFFLPELLCTVLPEELRNYRLRVPQVLQKKSCGAVNQTQPRSASRLIVRKTCAAAYETCIISPLSPGTRR